MWLASGGLLATIATFAALALGASPALALSPWWHLSSSVRPARVTPGSGNDEVQELQVAASSGEVLVEGEGKKAVFPYNATHEEVQAALEGLFGKSNGKSNVEVSGGSGDYRVTFVNALAEDAEAPITNSGLSQEACDQTPSLGECLTGEASVTVATAAVPDGTLVIQASNLGDAPTSGAIALTDVLPAGVTITETAGTPNVGFFGFFNFADSTNMPALCHVAGARATCTLPENPLEFPEHYEGTLRQFENIEMRIGVKVGVDTENEEAEVSGGGAAAASAQRSIPVGTAAPTFAAEQQQLQISPEAEGGSIDTQAGSHPYQLTTSFAMDQTADTLSPPALVRKLEFKLPAGLVANVARMPQCSALDFEKIVSQQDLCPSDTAIGVATVTFNEPKLHGTRTWPLPLFNLVPERGEPARFGFTVIKSPITLDTSVRTGGDYGVNVAVNNATQAVNLIGSSVTVWGTPGEASHNGSRGWECLANGTWESRGEACTQLVQTSPEPFLTLPTNCARPFALTVTGESWPRRTSPGVEPTSVSLPEASSSLQNQFGQSLGLTGCNQLSFGPSIETTPEILKTSSPTGMKVDVRVPQEASENARGLASSAIKDIDVALPEGVTVNPAGAGGLEACPLLTGRGPRQEEQEEHRELIGIDLETKQPANCPEASKIGLVKIKTPVLADPLEGALYVAAQDANPFGTLLATYLVAEDPISGVRIKLAGKVSLNAQTGQIETSFENLPQDPLAESEISLFGGGRATLATAPHCAPYEYTADAAFAPWSEEAPVGSPSTFTLTAGPFGASCPNAVPFSPSLSAGSTGLAAGAFSPLSTVISREDGNQALQSIQLHFPPGVSGILTGVKLCREAEANAGSCGAESLIGHSVASVGVGNEPYTVTGGQVFLTESYEGAPFGLSIVTPAVAGPFNLGKVVVRAKVEVNPRSAALTVTTGAIPHILDGIPLYLRHVSVSVDRPNFSFNPTSCDPMSVTGTATGVEGATAALSSPFQVANCALLKFTPKIAVSTAGHGSKLDGTSLHFKISYPAHAMGSQAWFEETKIDLPKQLPARNETLQKACLAHVFEDERAHCPAGSKIGTATVHTPVLPVPLTGPIYFVSYGGAKFPEAVFVLQGYGVTVELHGETFISKAGITSATFRKTPDVPFENIEVSIPSGRFSEFAINLPEKDHYNLCGHKLSMPTLFKAQNGVEIHQATPISVTGCRKAHKRKGKKKGKGKLGKKH
jgi:hypothetical protein